MKKTSLLVLIAFVILGIAGHVFAEEIGQMYAATNPSTVMDTAVLPSVWIPTTNDSAHNTTSPIMPETTGPVQSEPPQTEPDISQVLRYYFDVDRTHKPTDDDFAQLRNGMSTTEVINILGKPHDFGPTSGVPSLLWEAENGEEYFFAFLPVNDYPSSADIFVLVFEYGIIVLPEA